jgi:hypothetical protein
MPDANPCPHPRKSQRLPANEDNAAWLQTPDAQEFLSAQTRRDEKTGCLIWTGKTQKRFAYGYFYRRTRIIYAHRAAYAAVHGPIPKGKVICHRCDNPSCVAIEHLVLGTQEENLADMWRKGRGRWRSLLTRAHVVEIRKRLATGETAASIARDTGVSRSIVHGIKSGRTWGHVQGGTLAPSRSPRPAPFLPHVRVKAKDGTIYLSIDEYLETWPDNFIPLLRFRTME